MNMSIGAKNHADTYYCLIRCFDWCRLMHFEKIILPLWGIRVRYCIWGDAIIFQAASQWFYSPLAWRVVRP